MKIDMKLEGADNILSMLKSLPANVVSKRGGPVKLALAKGARIIRSEVSKNLQRVTADGDESTGLLKKSLIVSRGKAPITGSGERYLVRFKRKTYPDRKGNPVTTLKTAQILEYGSEKQAAEPFIRPAVISKAETAIRTINDDLLARIDKIVKKQLKGG
jgi:hypothetical protein